MVTQVPHKEPLQVARVQSQVPPGWAEELVLMLPCPPHPAEGPYVSGAPDVSPLLHGHQEINCLK